jgi:hypothetical protein
MFPAQIKSKALNSACVIKWKKAISGIFILRVNIIKATCLRVDNAIIFFISHSAIALNLAINIVRHEIIIKILLKLIHVFIKG